MQFWQRLKKIFQPSADEAAENQEDTCEEEKEELLSHEVFQRSPEELAAAKSWALSPRGQAFLEKLAQGYAEFKAQGRSCVAGVSFLCIPSVNGFVLQYSALEWTAEEFAYIFDYLKLQTATFGYWKQLADERVIAQGERVFTTRRYYLKPPRQFETPAQLPAPQFFGNIMICVCSEGGRPTAIKYSATHYNDRLYAPPLPFEDMMQQLTAPVKA